MDLDSWIVSTGAGQATGPPDTRDTLWWVVLAGGGGGGGYESIYALLQLLGNIFQLFTPHLTSTHLTPDLRTI